MGGFTEFSLTLQNLSNELDNKMPDVISAVIMVELEAKHKKRIFDDGLNSEGVKIGEYSTKPAYFSKDEFIRKNAFKGKGKPNGTKKKSEDRKSMYLQGGYSEFRDIQGRQNKFVNLKFSGSAERSIGIEKFADSTLYGVRDLVESKKLNGLISRLSDFLSLNESEQEFVKDEIKDQAIIIVKENGK